MLITLTTWASQEIETPPYRTLCQWAKNGQISGELKDVTDKVQA